MNYKIINTNTNESLITNETGLTGVIAAHCAPMGGLMGALESALIRQALESGMWESKSWQMRIEVTQEAVTHHTVQKHGNWIVTQPAVELGDTQTVNVLVVVNNVERTLSVTLQHFTDGNGWFKAGFDGVPEVGIESMVPVTKQAAPDIDVDGHYVEITFSDFALVVKLEDEGVVMDLLHNDESYVIDSTYAFYSELEEAV